MEQRRAAWPAVAIAVALVAIAIAAGLVLGGQWPAAARQANPTAIAPSPPAASAAATETPAETPTPAPTETQVPTPSPTAPSGTTPVRMRIPTIGVDAKVVHLKLNPDGSMPSPEGPNPVAWYTYSARSGALGNGVYSGHVDWHTGVTGVFWRLHELRPGDAIFITGADGVEYAYAVRDSKQYPERQAPVREITGPSEDERITLITCEGVFNRASRDYDKRRVVVAIRRVSS